MGPITHLLCGNRMARPAGHLCVTTERLCLLSQPSQSIFSLPGVYFCPFKWTVVYCAHIHTSASVLHLLAVYQTHELFDKNLQVNDVDVKIDLHKTNLTWRERIRPFYGPPVCLPQTTIDTSTLNTLVFPV